MLTLFFCHFYHHLELKTTWLVDASWLLFMFLWVELFNFNNILILESMVWAFVCNDEVIWINIFHRSPNEWMDKRQILFGYVHDGTCNLQLPISSVYLVESLMHLNFFYSFSVIIYHINSSLFIGPLRGHTVDFVKPFFLFEGTQCLPQINKYHSLFSGSCFKFLWFSPSVSLSS